MECLPEFEAKVRAWLEGRLPVETVKDNPVRTVQKGDGLYFKRFKEKGLGARVRRVLDNRAIREFRILKRLAEAGVGAPRPVAWGADRHSTFVVTREIPDARILKAELAGRFFPTAERRRLLAELAVFVRRVHEAGVRHDDFHIGNVLVGKGPTLHVLDVHRASIGRIGWPDRIRTLAFVLHSLSTFITRTEYLRFLKNYLGKRPDRRFVEKVRREFEAERRRYWANRQGRCLVESGEFSVEGGWFLRRPMTAAEAEGILTAQAAVVKELPKRSLRIVGRRFVKVDPHAKAVWRNARALEVRHLPTPTLWACGRGTVIGDWLADARPLWGFVKQCSTAERREAAFRLARLIRRMHDCGVYHHDLKANNVLVRSPGDFAIIDLDRVSLGRVSDARRRHNLAQLNAAVGPPATRTDRLRFYRWYAPFDRRWKQSVRSIMRLTRKRGHVWPG